MLAQLVCRRGALSLVLGLTATLAAAVPLPLVFESNQGQTDPRVRFLARSQGSSLFLLDDGGAVLSLAAEGAARHTVRMSLEGGQPLPAFQGTGEHGTTNYYRGKDPAHWLSGVPTWDRAHYTAVYPGIDLVYYANDKRLEFDFVVAPGADPAAILLLFEGMEADEGEKEIAVDGEGRLLLATPAGEVTFDAPRVYQDIAGERRTVAGHYQLAEAGKVRFIVGAYDASQPLVIDPVLVYSSFLGGIAADSILGTAVDTAGNLLVSGITQSVDFPLAAAAQPVKPGGWDPFVAKVSANGSQLIFSTYLGSSGYDEPGKVGVDAAGNAYIAGGTDGSDFPVLNAIQPQLQGPADFFITKLSPTGALVYSTYLGGTGADAGGPLDVTPDGKVYVAGWTQSTDFPVVNPAQANLFPSTCGEGPDAYPCSDLVVAVLSPAGSAILYATYWGGAGDDFTSAVAADSSGDIYWTAGAGEAGFPLVNPLQPEYGGGFADIAVLKIRPDGSQPVYSTWLGGSEGDWPTAIEVDAEHNAYVLGYTASTDLPLPYAIQPTFGGFSDWYVAKINPRGTGVTFGTLLGGSDGDFPTGISVDALGNLAITGRANSPTFPVLNPLPPGASWEAVVAKIHATGPTLLYSTHFGGTSIDFGNSISMDARGDVYFGGDADSEDFPLLNPFQSVYGGHGHRADYAEGFFAKLRDGKATLATPSRIPAQPGATVTVPVRFTPGGFDIAFTALSIDYDQTCLSFNPTDANADGLPDSIVFNLPPGFGKSVQFNAGDTDGEIDISLFDPSPPFSLLPLGEPLRITFDVQPTCGASAVSTLARVGFSSAPQVSFGTVLGQSAPGISLDGSVEVWGGLRGDCNGDLALNAGDLGASVLEVFDSDGAFWLDAPLSTFLGSPAGCDANADFAIDAGDLSCSVLLIFQGPGACSPTPFHASQPPVLDLEARRIAVRGGIVVPVTFDRGSSNTNSLAFSLALPDSLTFDPTDANGDGLPDAVSFRLPGGFQGNVQWTPTNRAGQLAFLVTDPTGQKKPLTKGPFAYVTLRWTGGATKQSPEILFGRAPEASFGDTAGRSIPGITRDASTTEK